MNSRDVRCTVSIAAEILPCDADIGSVQLSEVKYDNRTRHSVVVLASSRFTPEIKSLVKDEKVRWALRICVDDTSGVPADLRRASSTEEHNLRTARCLSPP